MVASAGFNAMSMSVGSLRNSEMTDPEESWRDGSAPVHRSVLMAEVLDALRPRPGGYMALDCTINGGGHSYGLLERSSPDGQVVGLDADAAALALAANRLAPFVGR